MSTPAGSDRVKAARIRGKRGAGAVLNPEEVEWLHGYERQQEENRGASQSRKVSYSEEETKAVGTGTAAEVAAAGAMVREEGRRLDSLTTIAVNAMAKACEMHEKMCAALLAERIEDAKVQRALLESVRTHYLARVDAEAEAAAATNEPEKDAVSKMIEEMLPTMLPMIMARLGQKS